MPDELTNLVNIMLQISDIGIGAVGMTYVIIYAAEIDPSVGLPRLAIHLTWISLLSLWPLQM